VDTLARAAARRQKYVTTAILVIGFGTAIAVYVAAGARPENPLGYEPLETKKYLHDLELYGGTANVLAAEFREWFAGLWYGRNLAFTIAVITVLLVLAVRLAFAMRAAPMVSSDAADLHPHLRAVVHPSAPAGPGPAAEPGDTPSGCGAA
jgi:hypothetical protein